MKSSRPKHVGFRVPNRVSVSSMFGIGQPSRPLVAALSWTKSMVSRHEPSLLGTGWTWLHSLACDSSMTPSSSSLLTCVRMASCFSAEWCRGGRRSRHLPLRSIDFDNHWVDLCGQGPDRCREYVDILSAKAPQLFLEPWRTLECNHGNDFIWRFEVRAIGTHSEWICLPFDVIVVHDGVQ